MAALEEVTGDLLTVNTQYIAHQCNCVTKYGKGLSAALFSRFPYADTYHTRRQPSPPGTIDVFGDGMTQRFVINMYAQYGPGRPRSTDDSAAMRLQWFVQCLEQVEAIESLQEIAFPWNIGCGLAGGQWAQYGDTLRQWAEASKAQRVLLVRLENT